MSPNLSVPKSLSLPVSQFAPSLHSLKSPNLSVSQSLSPPVAQFAPSLKSQFASLAQVASSALLLQNRFCKNIGRNFLIKLNFGDFEFSTIALFQHILIDDR